MTRPVRQIDHRIHIVIELIEANLHTDLLIGELAELVHLSPSRLSFVFKNETGKSIHQYIRMQRLRRAQNLLENTLLSIKEVMVAVGASDFSHFVRDFKGLVGCSPTAYRAQHFRPEEILKQFVPSQ